MTSLTNSLSSLSDSELKLARIKAYREKLRREREREMQMRFEVTKYEPKVYIEKYLMWQPWGGTEDKPGQQQIIDAYVLALRQQHEKRDFENGLLAERDLRYWKPGQVIKNIIRLEAGHTVGKTKLASGLVNHFFDSFVPAIIYTFAPSWLQLHDLLWKEIRTDRRDKGLPGRIKDVGLDVSDNHFAIGRATSDAGGKGTERVQGQHGEYLMFVIDEAEGVADYVFNAIDSMTSGGISIVLMLANPRTRASRFHKMKALSNVKTFRMSCIHHPNVIEGREVVPGAVKRDYVSKMLEKNAEIVKEHNEDDLTFELDFDIQVGETLYPKGTIFKPDAEFMFRVLGIAPANIADDTIISIGRYQVACKREKPTTNEEPRRATMGIDVARFGRDNGNLWVRHLGYVWRANVFSKKRTNVYFDSVKKEALRLAAGGVISLHIRIDGGGGFGSGLIDDLIKDDELQKAFFEFRVYEVHFGGSPYNNKAYYDLVTEMYGECAETLKGVKIVEPPDALEADLCERLWESRNVAGRDVKKLEEKAKFRKRVSRSPDDGDGFVLCVAPDFLFDKTISLEDVEIYAAERESPWK